jgi:hypothetical protein
MMRLRSNLIVVISFLMAGFLWRRHGEPPRRQPRPP